MVLTCSRALLHAASRLTQRRGFRRLIDVHPQVQRSLQRGEAVVALESTIITHGMPHPQNLKTAQEVEELVRQNGAQPATIAIIDGRLKVGLGAEDLARLAGMPQNKVIKCSRRDLAYLVACKQSGGTTVAATMIIAHMAGIKIFATGGVGGVHREGHITMDISADLIELGRTPVTVVSSGIKSILDIPRTLEYLETQGVCVAAYGGAAGTFPDFYTRDSGCKVPYNLEGPAHAASVIRAIHELELRSGMLIGVPIPEENAADKATIAAAIEEANCDAQRQGIVGKQVTPFLLAAIAKITKGHSLEANMALMKNNASVAAEIARELCSGNTYTFGGGGANTRSSPQPPLIIGASILDLHLTMVDDIPPLLDGATYRAHPKQSAGGVGRNIAESIFKLHGAADFVSTVGNDNLGKSLMEKMPAPLCKRISINNENATSLCALLFDKIGDCKIILGNMEIHQTITPDLVRAQENTIRAAPLVVMDSNLSSGTTECVLQLAIKHRRPVFFEPTDMRIAAKPFSLPQTLTQQIRMISPNLYELRTIVESITKKPVKLRAKFSGPTNELVEETKHLLLAIREHFDCIVVTLGDHGVMLSLKGEAAAVGKRLFDAQTGNYLPFSETKSEAYAIQFYAARKVENIANVSGAGDSFASGFITASLRGYEIKRCVGLGFLAAERTLQSESAVPAVYFNGIDDESNYLEEFLSGLKEIEM